MDFKDYIKQLAERITKLKDNIQTEEATKNAFIMPFIQTLGYDVFNPMEVVPEMDCDLVRKKGEKIDYAILKDGEPIILFECKHWMQDLDLHSTQLQKYFVASKAKFGVLTNGLIYRFYTDLCKPNLMDDTPFLEIKMLSLKDEQIEELKKFHKSYFNIENIISSAGELKYLAELKRIIKNESASPSDEFIKMLVRRIYDGKVTQSIIEQFRELVKQSINDYINDVISERLNIAIKSIDKEKESNTKQEEQVEDIVTIEKNKIVTTDEEIEAFFIVKSILRSHIPADKITFRDAQSYFSVFYDNNNRKPICRFYFNTTNKSIGVIGNDKLETKHKVECLDDIYIYSEDLIKSAIYYL